MIVILFNSKVVNSESSLKMNNDLYNCFGNAIISDNEPLEILNRGLIL